MALTDRAKALQDRARLAEANIPSWAKKAPGTADILATVRELAALVVDMAAAIDEGRTHGQ